MVTDNSQYGMARPSLYNSYIRAPKGAWNSSLTGAWGNFGDYGNVELFNNNGMIGGIGMDASGNPVTLSFDQLQGMQGTSLDGQGFQIGSQQDASGGFGNLGGYLSAGSGILQGLSGLAGAYTAYKGLELAKDQFAYQKGLANRNLANQAKIINNSYDNAGEVALGMIGSGSYNPTTDTQGSYGGMASQEVQDKYRQSAQAKHVDGSPV